MLYLARDILWMLLLAFIGGLVLGWRVWGRDLMGLSSGNVQARRVNTTALSEDDQEEMERLRNELEEIRRRRDELEVRNDGLRQQLQEGANVAIAAGATTITGSFAEDLEADEAMESLRRQNEEYAREISSLRAELSEYESVDELETLESPATLSASSLDDAMGDFMDDIEEDPPQNAADIREGDSYGHGDDNSYDNGNLLPEYSSAATETIQRSVQDLDSGTTTASQSVDDQAATPADVTSDWDSVEEESVLDEFVQNKHAHDLQANDGDFEDDDVPVITSFAEVADVADGVAIYEEDSRTPSLMPREETASAYSHTAEDDYVSSGITAAPQPASSFISDAGLEAEDDLLPEYPQPEMDESGTSAEPASPASAGVAPELLTEPVGAADDLKKISGVGPKLERVLNDVGIFHFWQIAELAQDEVDWLNTQIAFPGRIERENWIDQASDLASGGQTEFSLRYTDSDS